MSTPQANSKSYEAYGRYMVTRDRLNAVLDAAIIQETQMRVSHGVLLVSQLTPKGRLAVLRAILSQAGGEKADLVPMLAEITQELKRNAVAGGLASVAEGGLNFTRTDIGTRAQGSVTGYSADEMADAADTLAGHVDALAEALGIDEEALARLTRSVSEMTSKKSKEVLVDEE